MALPALYHLRLKDVASSLFRQVGLFFEHFSRPA